MTVFNIRTVRLQSGEQFRDVKEVELEPLELGGQRYVPIPEAPEAALTLTRLSSGLMLELELDVRLVGACAVSETPVSTSPSMTVSTRHSPLTRTTTSCGRRTFRTIASISPPGHATRSRFRCPTRFSAGQTAPASARCAAAT